MTAATGRVAVVVAATDARSIADDGLRRFAAEVRGRGSVVVVVADASEAHSAALDHPGIRVLRGRPGALAPELWRDGLRATDEPLVAFSTASMSPAHGWLDALLARLDESGAAVVGGPIVPGRNLSFTDRAVYLLRYVNYLSPLSRAATGLPGDNALYRRDRLDGLEALIDEGFWEAEIHRALRARGEPLALAAGATLCFQGGSSLRSTIRQRFRHARIYGASRASRMTLPERLARSIAAPLVPAVLGWRIARALRAGGESVGPWVASAPQLAGLSAAWTAGEVVGLWSTARSKQDGRLVAATQRSEA